MAEERVDELLLIGNSKGKFPPLFTGGIFHVRHVRDGKIIDEWDEHNLVVKEGLDHLLSAVLGGSSQITTWHVGIYGEDHIPVDTDVAADFASNAVESIAYDESFRPVWDSGAVGYLRDAEERYQ